MLRQGIPGFQGETDEPDDYPRHVRRRRRPSGQHRTGLVRACAGPGCVSSGGVPGVNAPLGRPLLRAARVALWLLCAAAQTAMGANVIVVTAEREGAHREAQEALVEALGPDLGAADIAIRGTGDLEESRLGNARVIVTIGTQAARSVAARRPTVPVLHTLLPREAFESLPDAVTGTKPSAIYLDQPEQRQLALLAAALPEQSRIALLSGPHSEQRVRRMAAAAKELRLQVAIERVEHERDIYPALERLLQDSPVLFAQPDNTIYNSYTIQNILLTSYRSRAPLIGFSPAYARAGALLALYSTPAQIGSQAAAAVRAVLAGRGLPAPQGPREFEVASNPAVARALGIGLDPPDVIAERVREREQIREARR